MDKPISIVQNIDCVEGMKDFHDKFFDLAIVDPQYGININNSIGRRAGDKRSNYKKAYWDNEPPTAEYFEQLFRVSKNQIVWGANYFISLMPYNSSCWLMWDKKFSEDVTFSQYEMAWTSLNGTCKKFEKHPTQENRIHATQKPIELYSWILERYAKQGDKILDTHLGSQSSRIASYKKGFDFWGFELDEDYYNQGNERFEKAIAMPLFDVPKITNNIQLSI